MSTFSALLSSIGVQPQAAQETSITSTSKPLSNGVQPPPSASTTSKLAADNVRPGLKRKAEESTGGERTKVAKTESSDSAARSLPSANASRFQLSAKAAPGQKPVPTTNRPALGAPPSSRLPSKLTPIPTQKPTASSKPPQANGGAPAKRGFASLLERAKAAQEAAKAAGPAIIKHKAVERLSKKERQKLLEEQKPQERASKRNGIAGPNRPQNPSSSTAPASLKAKGAELSYQGTMRKSREPLSYKGTMRQPGYGDSRSTVKKKTQPEGKYGGYASWSDLDDAEDDDEEDGWNSAESSDMEGGFDDVEREEALATRAAKQEDQAALEEEEKHRREKMERKRKLMQLSKTAAAKRRY